MSPTTQEEGREWGKRTQMSFALFRQKAKYGDT